MSKEANESTAAAVKAWPWVDGEDRSEKEPLPLVCPEDDRLAVRDLIEKHRKKIDQVREKLKDDPLYEPAKHDNLWILRFILSQKSVKKATSAAKATLVYRNAHDLDKHDVRKDWPGPNSSHDNVKKYYNCIKEGSLVFSCPHPQRGIMAIILFQDIDQNRMVQELTRQEWPLKELSEWTFQMVDSMTRHTGRMTKTFRVLDVTGISFSFNREFVDRESKASKSFEDFYPQVLQAVFILNPPTVFYVLFKLLSPLFPRRFVEKFNMLNPTKSRKDLEPILKYVSEDHFPQKFGGKHPDWPFPTKIET